MSYSNHYEILGVDASFTRAQLKEAYHAKLFQSHPDKNMQNLNDSNLDLKVQNNYTYPVLTIGTRASVEEIKIAYNVLNDPVKREAYDLELAESSQKHGINFSGAGLDEYTLAEFHYSEANGDATWTRDCPRCTATNAIILRENDLEQGTSDGTGGYRIAVSCQTCSLWITVSYEEEDE